MIQGYANAATNRGNREYQEDRYLACSVAKGKEKGWLLAVMDGHSDSAEVAEICEKNALTHFLAFLGSGREYDDLFFKKILRLVIGKLHKETKKMSSGSTISLVYISETQEKVFVAVLGDSPVIVKTGKRTWISPEHNIRTNDRENIRVTRRGAAYNHGYMVNPRTGHGLQLTRALGDSEFDKFLGRRPQVFSKKLDKSSFVLVASDGLMDPGHDTKDTDSIVEMVESGKTACDLVRDALERQTGDNVTVVLWRQPKS